MTEQDKELLEKNDLFLLHSQYQKDIQIYEAQEIQISSLQNKAHNDIWTKALLTLSSKNVDEIKRVHIEILESELLPESKRWWNTMFSMIENAPLQELEKLSKYDSRTASRNHAEYLNVISADLARRSACAEKEKRRLQEEKNEELMASLRREAEQRQHALNDAQRDLRNHRTSRR